MADNDYIFREKIRHPSTDEWIISRDYGPINKIDTSDPQTMTITADTFNLKAKSYNYKASSNNTWINNNDYIDKNSVTSLWSAENKDLIDDKIIFNGITTVPVSVVDFTTTYTDFTGYYDTGDSNTVQSIKINDSNPASWNDLMITQSLSSSVLTGNHIKNNDIIIIPKVNSDNSFTMDAYSVDKNINTATAITTINFIYDVNNADDKNIVNIINNYDNDNNITLSDMWSSCDEITSFTFTSEGYLDTIGINNNVTSNIDNLRLYGNGTLLNRFSKDVTFQNVNFDYNWFIIEDNSDSTISPIKYIVQLEYNNTNSNYKIKNLYKINIIASITNKILTLQQSSRVISYDNLPEFHIGWTDSSYLGNTDDFAQYKLFGCYSINNDINFSKSYNTENIVKTEILKDNQLTDLTVTNVVYTPSTTLNIYANSVRLNTVTYAAANNSYTSVLTYNKMSTTLSFTPNQNSNDLDITFDKADNHLLEEWWDNILNQNVSTAYDKIYIDFLLSSRTGAIVYEKSESDIYGLQTQSWSGANNISSYSINNLWNNIIVTRDSIQNSNKIVISRNKISYPVTNNQTVDHTFENGKKIWILLPNTPIKANAEENATNDYFISINDLKTTDDFIYLIKDLYTDIEIIINIPSEFQTIQYILYQYANGIRLCDTDGNLLNIGDEWTPVFIKNGQFVACNDIRDVFIHTQNTEPSYGALWVDTDGS